MIIILTTTNYDKCIAETIETIDRLSELVSVFHFEDEIDNASKLLIVEEDIISTNLDWYDTEPPYVFPKIPFTKNNLLALIFYKLGNHQKAFEYVDEKNSLYHHLLTATHLQFGYELTENMFSKIESLHNKCVVKHYGNFIEPCSAVKLKQLYKAAIDNAENDEVKVFTAKHFCNFLLDGEAFKDAEIVIRSLHDIAISSEAKNTLHIQLAYALMPQLQLPYDENKLEEISTLFENAIGFYESKGKKVNAGLLYIDASEIANFQDDYITSKNLINKAILYFKEANIPEFLGEAGLRKATLLYTWSKDGSPQYYKPAINAFQDTLKVFKRDTHPQKFADVHHNLALIYSEIPVSSEEKPIWTAFCASSFKEVLKYYCKEKFPYQHAMVSHNYATAIMRFPEAKLHNNCEKAYDLFETALAIRSPNAYPFERALTLVNQLELCWLMHNKNEEEEIKNFKIMLDKANEIKQLVSDETLSAKADEHLEALKKLKPVIS